MASGKRDSAISDAVTEAVSDRLDVVCHVFNGTTFTVRAAAIVMYQAVMFLERNGVVIQSKDKGRLTTWINAVIARSNDAKGIIGYQRPLQQIVRRSAQRAFWDEHLKIILAMFEADKVA